MKLRSTRLLAASAVVIGLAGAFSAGCNLEVESTLLSGDSTEIPDFDDSGDGSSVEPNVVPVTPTTDPSTPAADNS